MTSDRSPLPRRWLITGGAGFIGTNLAALIASRQLADQVRIVDDLTASSIHSIEQLGPVRRLDPASAPPMGAGGGIELAQVSVTDADAACRLAEGADLIIHLAANTSVQESVRDPRMDAAKNVFGILNYLEAARICAVRSFVFASSGAPTGSTPPPIHEDAPCKPMSPYGVSKMAGEGYCFAYSAAFGLNTVALRFSNVYGPHSRDTSGVVSHFLKQALAGRPWVINGDGAQTRDFIFVDDVAEAILRAAHFDGGGELFQIATGRETSIADLAALMGSVLRDCGVETQVRFGAPLKGEITRNFADISKARGVLDWEPRCELESGIRRTVEWYLGEG